MKAVRDQLTKKKKMLEDLADEVAGAKATKKKQDKDTARRKKKELEQGAHGEHTVVHAADMSVKCPDPSLHAAYEMAWEYFDPSQVWRKFSQDVTDDIEIVLDDPKALAKAHGTVRVESDGIKYFVYIKKRQCVDCDTGQVMEIRRRKPAIKTETILQGIGVGDKAIRGDDLTLGRDPNRKLEPYEKLLESPAYKVPEDYIDHVTPTERATNIDAELNERQLAAYWGGAPVSDVEKAEKARSDLVAQLRQLESDTVAHQKNMKLEKRREELEDAKLRELAKDSTTAMTMYEQLEFEVMQADDEADALEQEARLKKQAAATKEAPPADEEEKPWFFRGHDTVTRDAQQSFKLGPRTAAGVDQDSRNHVKTNEEMVDTITSDVGLSDDLFAQLDAEQAKMDRCCTCRC